MRNVGTISATVGGLLMLLVVVLTCSSSAFATSRTVVASVGIQGSMIDDVNTVRQHTWGPATLLSVTCYYAPDPSNPDAVCAGGGDFDPSGSTICADNGATVLQDASGYCFYRKNFGLNSVVDARQCGVVGDGKPAGGTLPGGEIHPDDGTILNTCMSIASKLSDSGATLQNTLHIVTTGGGVILANTDNIDIPANTELTCSGTGTGPAQPLGQNSDDYRRGHVSNAIVLSPGHTVKLHNDNVTYAGCTEIEGPGTYHDGTAMWDNPYSPFIWYPFCKDIPAPGEECDEYPDPNLRSSTNEYSAFNPNPTAAYPGGGPASNSVGITLTTGDNLTIRDVTVLGFGTCYSSGIADGRAGKHLVIERLYGDCNTGISVDQSPDETHFNTFLISPILNRSLGSGGSAQTFTVHALVNNGSLQYKAYVEVGGHPTDFSFQENDTVWIATDTTTHAESAAGRWMVDSDVSPPTHGDGTTCPTSVYCQSFTLKSPALGEPDSRFSTSTSPLAVTGTIRSVTTDGVPPTAITGISTVPGSTDQQTLQLVAIGQMVTGTCIPSGTTVTDLWLAQGIVYISQPATCAATESIGFYDADSGFTPGSDCVVHPEEGCATVNATERFGDGVVVTNSGGVTAVNCQTYEHLVSFHFSTDANSSRFANCGTGENEALPDQDIIGLKIDGEHQTGEGAVPDACGTEFVNGILGQHRTVGILVQTNCDTPNHLSNVRFSGNAGGRRSAVALEVDAGTVAITNSDAFGRDNLFKAEKTQLYDTDGNAAGDPVPAYLSIGNNQFPRSNLFMADNEAAGSTTGCGNQFPVPTPYLCAPSSFTQLPGGRLTLTTGQPVMTADVTGAGTVYYVPYISQQVPIYSGNAGVFGLTDIGGAGLSLSLSGIVTGGSLYDVFVETGSPTGQPEMCLGPAWSSAAAGSSARAASGSIVQVNSVWANQKQMVCTVSTTAARMCPPLACTYVGTFLTDVAASTVSQQFNPAAASGGAGPCLCLYNAYNRVAITSRSIDNVGYTYASSSWRVMHNSNKNRVTVVDGLGQMQISAQLADLLSVTAAGQTAEMGIDFNITPIVATPGLVVQATATTPNTYNITVPSTPFQPGMWNAQAVEAAPGSTGTANFGSSTVQAQQLSVQVAD